MTKRMTWIATVTLLTVAAVIATAVVAQEATSQPTNKPSGVSAGPPTTTGPANESADDVAERLRNKRQAQPGPNLRGDARDAAGDRPLGAIAPTAAVSVDPAVIGTAPGLAKPNARREGEFISRRRGRLQRANAGARVLFVFDADSAAAPEPPMILVPCGKLELMENIVKQHNDQLIFEVTGQILTYRGTNYLLPLMAKPAQDQGNLRN